MCSPAALIARASSNFFRTTFSVGLCSIKTSIHIRRGVVHDHSGGVYPVPYRTRKSRPPASLFVLWYESPREGVSLCLFHSSLPGSGRPFGRPGPTFYNPPHLYPHGRKARSPFSIGTAKRGRHRPPLTEVS